MPGLGTIADSLAIFAGAVLGILFKRGLPQKWQETMMSGIALCIFLVGMQMALKTHNIVIVCLSLVIGSILGEIIDIEGGMNKIGGALGKKIAGGETTVAAGIAEGFVNASVLFASGAMAIVGSIQDGLMADPTTLYAKATIDGIISLVLSANIGVGVALSAVTVAVYQGVITLLAGSIGPLVTDAALAELTASGGVMIMAIGTNMLHLTKIRVGNMVPGMFAAVVLTKFMI